MTMKIMFPIIFLFSLFHQLDANKVLIEHNTTEIEIAQELEPNLDVNKLKSNISLSTHNILSSEGLMNIRPSTSLFSFSSVSRHLKSALPNAPPLF
jgi:hypothetical protein